MSLFSMLYKANNNRNENVKKLNQMQQENCHFSTGKYYKINIAI